MTGRPLSCSTLGASHAPWQSRDLPVPRLGASPASSTLNPMNILVIFSAKVAPHDHAWLRQAMFLVLYVLCGSATLVFLFSSTALSVFALYVGMIFPPLLLVLFVPTAFVYMTAIWPSVLLRRSGASFSIALGLAAACSLTVAFGPPLLGRSLATRTGGAVAVANQAEPMQQTPRRISFARELVRHGPDSPLFNAPCDGICQRLLLGREADLVLVKTLQKEACERQSLTRRRRAACPPVFSIMEDTLPQTTAATVAGIASSLRRCPTTRRCGSG